MSYAERHRLAITTDSGGDATVFTPEVQGKVSAVIYTKDGTTPFDAGVDFTITAEKSGQNIWTEVNVDASKTVAPRQPTHDAAGVASLHAAAGEPVEDGIILANERVRVVIAAGGNAKLGQIDVIIH